MGAVCGLKMLFFWKLKIAKQLSSREKARENVITVFLWQKLNDLGLDYMRLQQNGATCPIFSAKINLLREKFNDLQKCLREPIIDPRSYDISRLGYVHWLHWLTPINRELSMNFFTQIFSIVCEITVDLCGKVGIIDADVHRQSYFYGTIWEYQWRESISKVKEHSCWFL